MELVNGTLAFNKGNVQVDRCIELVNGPLTFISGCTRTRQILCGFEYFFVFMCGCVILRNMQGPFYITLNCATYYMATFCIAFDCAICKYYNHVLSRGKQYAP